MSASSALIIYQSQGPLTLLSRAWNLLRANLKKCLLIMALPTLMNTVFHVLLSLLSNKSFLTSATATDFVWRILLLGGAMLFSIPTLITWLVSCCLLCRFFYLSLLCDEAPSIRDCLRYLGKIWLPLTGLIMLLGLMVLGLIMLNFIVFYLGLMLVGVTVVAMGATGAAADAILPKLMMVAFVLVIGFVAFVLLISLGALEGFLFSFPVTSLLTAQEGGKKSVWRHIGDSYKLLFRYFPGVVTFSIGLLLLSWTMMGVMAAPAYLWMIIEMTRTGFDSHHTIPLYAQTILNIWSSLTNLVMMPFLISAMTLFWYDCQVRGQGLDIRLWLDKIRNRGGGQPSPETVPS